MNEYQYLTIVCDNCDTPYEIRWDGEHPSAPLTCPFCGHELEDDPEWSDPIERFTKISSWVHTSLRGYGDMELFAGKTVVHLEGYSYGSKGQAIFQIAENCGILKYSLLNIKIEYNIIVPSIVKKFATDKGNANKELMYEHFCKDTKTDLMKTLDMQTLSNPITDIVDSYYIARCGYESSKGK